MHHVEQRRKARGNLITSSPQQTAISAYVTAMTDCFMSQQGTEAASEGTET